MLDPMKKRVLDDVDEYSAEYSSRRFKAPPANALPPSGDAEAEVTTDGGGPEMPAPDAMEAAEGGEMEGGEGMVEMQLSPDEAKMIEEYRASKGAAPGTSDMGGIDVASLAAQLGE